MNCISVIIPVYNTGRYLCDAIDSVLAQEVEDMEVICVNDGSTDDSLTILEDYAARDSRVRVFSQANQGQSVARNTGMQHAKGRYIYFMDSDDILKPDCFRRCLEVMREADYDFVFFDGDILCEQGPSNICWDYHRTAIYQEGTAYKGAELMHSLLDNYTHRAVPWLLFVKHDYIRRLGLTFYPSIIHEDELYTTLLTLQSDRIGCIKESYVEHRVRANSTMTNHYSRRNVDCYLTVVDELMKWGQQHKDMLPLLRKYARYTLDKVFYTSHVLPLKQKIALARVMIQKKYTTFVSTKNWLRFLLK